MADDAAVSASCSTRGFLFVPEMSREVAPYRASHLRDFAALQEYSATLPEETRGWMLALFVDSDFGLLSVETIARDSISSTQVSAERLIGRGLRLKAAGFFLVHNHPSGETTPRRIDIGFTRRLADICHDYGIPVICHVVVAKGKTTMLGGW